MNRALALLADAFAGSPTALDELRGMWRELAPKSATRSRRSRNSPPSARPAPPTALRRPTARR